MGDYAAEARRVAAAFNDTIIGADQSGWKRVKSSDGVTIACRDSDYIKGEQVYKAEMLLNCSPESALAMGSPLLHYRKTWDPFLDKLQLVSTVDRDIYMIYHSTKPALKGLISARDSLDLVTVGECDEYYFVAAGGTDHPDYPPFPNMRRTFQYPSGYAIHKISGAPDRCKFEMVFHADINVNQVGRMMANLVKPKLMIQKMTALRDAVGSTIVDPNDIEKAKPGQEDNSITKL